jgi:uncharacterized membrane protein
MAQTWLRRVPRGLVFLCGTAVVLAPFGAHAAIATGHLIHLALGFAAIQAVAMAAMAWRMGHGPMRVAGVAVAMALLVLLATRMAQPDTQAALGVIAASGASHCILYTSLLLLFGRTLQPGHTPLVTSLATRMRGALTPAMVRYTRGVTWAWCCFFAGQLMLSGLLLEFAPHRVWSLFVNVLDGPMVAVMFICEYALRRRRFRGVTHESPAAIFRAFAARPAAPSHANIAGE